MKVNQGLEGHLIPIHPFILVFPLSSRCLGVL